MKILVLTIRLRQWPWAPDIYLFSDRNANILPTVKEWLLKNGVELAIPDHVTDSKSFFDWYRNADEGFPEAQAHVSITTYLKQLLDE